MGASDDAIGESLESFLAARGPVLFRAAWLLTGDSHAAEDLVQTALAKSYSRYVRLGPEQFEPYVRRVMFTTFLSWRGRRWTGEIATGQLPETEQHDLNLVTDRSDLLRAIRRLPRAQRAVIVLRYVEDLTERETAEILGVAIGTVKSHASRALAALRVSTDLRRD